MPDVIESIRDQQVFTGELRFGTPQTFESSMSALTAGIGGIHASNNLSDEDLSRLNAQLTRLQLVVSAKWCDRK